MLAALERVPRNKRRQRAQEWGARGNASQHKARIVRGVDFETILFRAKENRRGKITREGCSYFGDGRVVSWAVQHSTHGRSDQFDIVVDGIVWRTGGIRLINIWFKG